MDGHRTERWRPLALAGVVFGCALAAPPAQAMVRHDGRDASGPLDVTRVELGQVRKAVRWQVRTDSGFRPVTLDRSPDFSDPDERFLCLRLRVLRHVRQTQLCFGPPGVRRDSQLGWAKIGADGSVLDRHPVPARVLRLDRRTIEARFTPRLAGLGPGRYRWRLFSRWSGGECPTAEPAPKRARRAALAEPPCRDLVPDDHQASYRLFSVRPVGCHDSSPSPVYHGPRNKRAVALTFDDGPTSYTSRVLSILEQRHAHGTFFQVGELVPGRSALERSLVRHGHELANHSLHHKGYPSYSSMAETSRRIEAASGFRPCLFRPPGGAFGSQLVSDARALGMTTVIWDVDPQDWTRPGSDAIYQRVVSATRPGSIILLHDGGGDRSQTVAALPRIIGTLRERGYRMVTVSRLLGQRTIWRPLR